MTNTIAYLLLGAHVVVAVLVVAIDSILAMHGMGKEMDKGQKEREKRIKTTQTGQIAIPSGEASLTMSIPPVDPTKTILTFVTGPDRAHVTLLDDSTILATVPTLKPYPQVVTWRLREYY